MSRIIQAKLDLPAFASFFRRGRLDEALALALGSRALCIRAGPGFGKTALIAEYVRRRELPVVWVQVDESDADPGRLATYILAGLAKAIPGIPAELREAVGRRGDRLEDLLAQCIEALEKAAARAAVKPVLVVLNDLDLAHGPETARFVRSLVEYMPAGATLWFTCQLLPDLPLERWKVLHLAHEVGQSDLALSAAETRGFCREVFGIDLAPAETDLLHRATAGWIAGMVILWNSSGVRSKDGLLRSAQAVIDRVAPRPGLRADQLVDLMEYITNQVLRRQPEDVLTMLRCTAVLPFVSVDAVAEVCGFLPERASAAVRVAMEAVPFILRLEQGRFAYQPMLRAALVELMHRECVKEQVSDLYTRAGAYLVANGWREEAVTCLLQAGHRGPALAILEQIGLDMAHRGRMAALVQWLDSLPAEVIESRPLLAITAGCVRQSQGRMDEALALWQRGAEGLAAPLARQDAAHDLTLQQQAMAVAVSNSANVLADRGRAAEGLRMLEVLLEAGQTGIALSPKARAQMLDAMAYCQWMSSDWDKAWATAEEAARTYGAAAEPFGEATVLNVLGVLFHEPRGDYERALSCYTRALGLVADYGPSPQMVLYLANRGNILKELDRPDESLSDLESAVAAGQRLGLGRQLMLGLIFLGRAYLDQGRFAEARNCLERALSMATDMGDRLRIGAAQYELANLHRTLGDLDLALTAAEEDLRLIREIGNPHFLLQSLVNVAFVRLFRLEHEAALRLLREAEACPAAHHTPGMESVRLYLGLGIALQAGGDTAWTQYLRKCLAIAEGRAGAVVFRREHPLSTDLLRLASAEGIRRPQVAALIAQAKPVSGVSQPPQQVAALENGEDPAAFRGGRLRMRCLGGFSVWVDGNEVPVTAWRKAKALRLFKLVVCARDQWVPVEQIVEMLWPDMTASAGLANFRVTLHHARRTLNEAGTLGDGEFVQYEQRRCRVNPEMVGEVDAHNFGVMATEARRLAAGGRADMAAQAFERAQTLYRGDFLPDDVYEDWTEAPRTAMRNVALEALAWLADYYSSRGDAPKAVDRLRRAVALDPYREDLQRSLMTLLAGQGRLNEALQQYRRLEQALIRDLDVGPTEETLGLYRRLMRAGAGGE